MRTPGIFTNERTVQTMPRRAMLQDARASASDPAVICSFDYEVIEKPTRAIIHQAARFLYVKRGGAGKSS